MTQFFVQFVKSLDKQCESPVSAADAFYTTEICLRAGMAADQQKMLKLPKPR